MKIKFVFYKEETSFDNILTDKSFNDSVKDILFFIELKIVEGFSDGEIAAMLHISRQAINKMKKKLKIFLDFREKRN